MRNRLPPDEERRLAAVLHQILELAPLSMRAIEEEAGLARGTLSKIHHGRIRLGFHHVQRVAMALDFSVRDFYAYAYGDPDAVRRMVAGGAEFLEGLPPATYKEEVPTTLTAADRQGLRAFVRKLLAQQYRVLGIKPPTSHEVARQMARMVEMDED